MDIWGVPGVEAEAEVLSALVASLQGMGLTVADVGIKVWEGRNSSACCCAFDSYLTL